jgi:signal transduction histidine kinase
VLQYRLWDIDVVIQRSLVYGTLWLAIAGAYFGLALALGLAASSQMPVWSAVGLTVLATLLFQPARHWLEAAADRWVFRRRQEPLKVVYGFGETLGGVDQANDIAGQLARVAATAAPLAWVRVEALGSAISEGGQRRAGPVVEIALVSGRQRFGALFCQPLAGSQLTEEERATLATLASQAALAISRAQLASRIVRAQELERRRIERNIHDGAQQELVALVARLGLARSQNGATDHSRLLSELQEEIRTILGNLRDLAQGVHPSVLTDGGLVVAVEDRCSRLTIPIKLDISPALRAARFGEDIEAAAYFVVAEGLTNLMRHSDAASASVSLQLEGPCLTVAVADDGSGFETGILRSGGGLQGLSDRLQALGGELLVESAPGKGSRIRASLPLQATMPA